MSNGHDAHDASRYTRLIDLDDPTSSHSMAVLATPAGSDVLDVGCGEGHVAAALVERGCQVWGIEIDPEAAVAAQSSCEAVVVGDVAGVSHESLDGRTFDVILLLDVLEHVVDPLGALRHVTAWLAPGGKVIVSIPNVAHAAVRLALLQGRFEYSETGLLDETHLRFFDRRSLGALIRDAGLNIVDELRVRRRVDETEIEVDLDALPAELRSIATAERDAETYQFVVIAGRRFSDDVEPHSVCPGLASIWQRRAEQFEDVLRQTSEYVTAVERESGSRAAYIDHLEDEISGTDGYAARFAEAAVRMSRLESDLVLAQAECAELSESLAEATRQVHVAEAGQRRAAEQEILATASARELIAELAVRARERDALAASLDQVTARLGVLHDAERAAHEVASRAPSELEVVLAARSHRWGRRRRSPV